MLENEMIVEFISNPIIQDIPGFREFRREILKFTKPAFTPEECEDIRSAIEDLKECNESWAENGDIQMAASHDLIINAMRKAIRKGRKC